MNPDTDLDLEELALERALYPWLDDDSLADEEPYQEDDDLDLDDFEEGGAR